MLMLDFTGGGSKQVTVEAQPNFSNPRIVLDMMDKAIQAYGSDQKQTIIKKAKILIKFGPINGRRSKRFTLNIGLPNSDNLKDDPYHNMVRELIKRWGLVRTLIEEAEAA